jgi:hypothetical protein
VHWLREKISISLIDLENPQFGSLILMPPIIRNLQRNEAADSGWMGGIKWGLMDGYKWGVDGWYKWGFDGWMDW